jgi:serine/threonine protein kinase/Tol biopolymer transport system component
MKLGPYEILSPLGAGGMGEVYRARDPRLGREVAIKVLPTSFSADAGRLRRFEQEARAAGILNHPNITAVYDIGEADGAPYVVSELLEGETLRSVLAGGKLSARKAIDYSLQIAHGLAAAHEKGIVHRDLKPENLFVTRDGRVKILDFGLAKLIHPEPLTGSATSAPTATAGTEPGVVLGTVGYMSPEQVRGEPADHRSDIFSFGTVLYEMIAGRRPFRGDTAVETMSAILKEDPPKLATEAPDLPSGAQRIVDHCLEKDRGARFQSARDLAFDLESLSGIPAAASTLATIPRSRRRLSPALAGAALVVVAIAAFLAGSRADLFSIGRNRVTVPSFHQLTFRRGYISRARFAPDGQTVVHDAAWDGQPAKLFSIRVGSAETSPLALPQGTLLSVSPSEELGVLLGGRAVQGFSLSGTLGRMPLGAGAAREILEKIQEADWSPDGKSLAIVRRVGDQHRLEYPPGKILFTTQGWVSQVRISPDGSRIAFFDHPWYGDDAGSVAVIDSKGRESTLSRGWSTEQGLAWSPSGREVWFTAASEGSRRALYAVTLEGRQRPVLQAPASLRIHDIFRDGRALLTNDAFYGGILGVGPGASKERDLSWRNFSFAVDLSADGRTVLISAQGEGAGASYGVYLRDTDGSPAVRLGDGTPFALSPDKKWALTLLPMEPSQLVLLPTSAGEPRRLHRGTLESYGDFGCWSLDGRRILFHGRERGHETRLYVQTIDGEPRAISPEGITPSAIGHDLSSDGRFAFARDAAGQAWLYPVDGGAPKALPGVQTGEDPVGWSTDGKAVYVMATSALPSIVYRVELDSARRTVWKDLTFADSAGINYAGAHLVMDGKAYTLSFNRDLSELYVVNGLK